MFEPNADARQNAAFMFNQYRAYVDAGFTEPQAMALMQSLISGIAIGASQK